MTSDKCKKTIGVPIKYSDKNVQIVCATHKEQQICMINRTSKSVDKKTVIQIYNNSLCHHFIMPILYGMNFKNIYHTNYKHYKTEYPGMILDYCVILYP